MAAHPRRIELLVQAHFRLQAATPVQVRQAATTLPGFPPVQTDILFWAGNRLEHRWRIFKPAEQVTAEDLPPWWMKDALVVDDLQFCACCG